MRFRFLIVVTVVLLLSGCEKTVSFDLDDLETVPVVDATIEDGQPPVVILSGSFNYFSAISPEMLLNSFIHNAEVTISNGTVSQKLKEYSRELAQGIRIFYYTSDSSYGTSLLRGELNKSYTLEIKVDGKTLTASTTIPALAKKIDSLWWKKAPFSEDTNKVVLMSKVTDPPGYGNYIRYFTSTNQGPFLPAFTSAWDDQIIDGVTYEIEVERGVDRNAEIDMEDYSFFHRGDTVTVKFTNIDKTTYDFWRTMEYSYSSIGNPFSSPTKVLGNVQGGALGYFGGYAVQFKTLIIPK
jgi:hypothetical protein